MAKRSNTSRVKQLNNQLITAQHAKEALPVIDDYRTKEYLRL